jgi:hypothetical protein
MASAKVNWDLRQWVAAKVIYRTAIDLIEMSMKRLWILSEEKVTLDDLRDVTLPQLYSCLSACLQKAGASSHHREEYATISPAEGPDEASLGYDPKAWASTIPTDEAKAAADEVEHRRQKAARDTDAERRRQVATRAAEAERGRQEVANTELQDTLSTSASKEWCVDEIRGESPPPRVDYLNGIRAPSYVPRAAFRPRADGGYMRPQLELENNFSLSPRSTDGILSCRIISPTRRSGRDSERGLIASVSRHRYTTNDRLVSGPPPVAAVTAASRTETTTLATPLARHSAFDLAIEAERIRKEWESKEDAKEGGRQAPQPPPLAMQQRTNSSVPKLFLHPGVAPQRNCDGDIGGLNKVEERTSLRRKERHCADDNSPSGRSRSIDRHRPLDAADEQRARRGHLNKRVSAPIADGRYDRLRISNVQHGLKRDTVNIGRYSFE